MSRVGKKPLVIPAGKLAAAGLAHLPAFEVRGEVVMPLASFRRLAGPHMRRRRPAARRRRQDGDAVGCREVEGGCFCSSMSYAGDLCLVY